jgi:hypothetical protein
MQLTSALSNGAMRPVLLQQLGNKVLQQIPQLMVQDRCNALAAIKRIMRKSVL